MDIKDFFNPTEKPLETLTNGAGFFPIFRTVACIGDSLSSGEFESTDQNKITQYHDFYEYSWGQFIAREAGCLVYNFSKGGMTAKEYMTSFAEQNDLFNPDKKAQCYIIALGVNDISYRSTTPLGSIEDVSDTEFDLTDSFAAYYGNIIKRYKQISPKAKFFLVTMPKSDYVDEIADKKADFHSQLLHAMADKFSNTYVVDLRKHAPRIDKAYRQAFYMGSHLNAMGYILSGKMIMSYIDYIIRHNMSDFKQVGFINTPFSNNN